MKNFEIEIQGIAPLLTHRFTDAAQMEASSGVHSSGPGDKSAVEQAEETLYKDEEGHVGIPSPNLHRCFTDAGKYIKLGRSKVSTTKTSIVPAAVFITPAFIQIKSKSGWKVDTRPVRIPSTGGRVQRHRACFDDWKLKFSVELEDTLVSAKLLRELVDIGGRRIGLGDYRPDTKGPFGRFVISLWKEV